MTVCVRRLLIPLAMLASPALAAPFTVEPGGKSYATLADAVLAIGDGDGAIRIAPGIYRDCAVQRAGRISYRAETPLTAIFDGGICEGKAVLVLRGRGASVDGLVFRNLTVPDGNAAGIRIEKGPLDVSRSIFRDSEQGILGGGDKESDIRIDRATFTGLGRCDRGLGCAHSLYVGGYRSVTVRRSRFEKGRGGHYVKSRAARIDVRDSSFDDSQGRATNYMIDLPSGAVGRIVRTVFVQGADKENHSGFIVIAAEGRINASAGLLISHNKAHQVRSADWPSAFVFDLSGSAKRIAGNQIGGRVEMMRAAEAGPPSFSTKIKSRLRYYAGRLRARLGE